MAVKRRTFAVVGADGFFGRRTLEILDRDARAGQIVAIGLRPHAVRSAKIAFERVDLTSPSAEGELTALFAARGVDTVVHAAFLARPVQNRLYAHDLEAVGTVRVLNACAAADVRKIVVTSTTAVYGARPDHPNFLREDVAPIAPRRPGFIADKAAADREALAFAAAHPERLVTVLRFASILGPTVEGFQAHYLRRTFVPTVLGFDPLVQVIHEDDAVEALRLALERDAPGALNIGAPIPIPLSHAIRLAHGIAIPLPWTWARLCVDMMSSAGLVAVNGDVFAYLRHLWVADTSRAEQTLGFRARHTAREAVLALRGAADGAGEPAEAVG
jgi:UDP-glucose 4-epimerase